MLKARGARTATCYWNRVRSEPARLRLGGGEGRGSSGDEEAREGRGVI